LGRLRTWHARPGAEPLLGRQKAPKAENCWGLANDHGILN